MTSSLIKVYPLKDEFIGTFQLEGALCDRPVKDVSYQTIIIMDRSGSMGEQAARLASQIIPLFFSKLNYQSSNVIHLIAFESKTVLYNTTVGQVKSLGIMCGGNTRMQPAVAKCLEVFQSLDVKKPVRVLTISDGEVYDQLKTAAAADGLSKYLVDKNFLINSKAVRLFTSGAQPDTTALCSLLQINNATSSSLVDILSSQSDEFIATKMAEMFQNDNFSNTLLLTSLSNVIRPFPWNSTTTLNLPLLPGYNIFWLSNVPLEGFKVDGVVVKILIQPPLTAEMFIALMKPKIGMITEKMKVSKVADSQESREVVQRMDAYFKDVMATLPSSAPKSSGYPSDTLFKELHVIANDKTVIKMSQADKAKYLCKPRK